VQKDWYPYLAYALPTLSWSTAREKDEPNTAYTLTEGKYDQESNFTFDTGILIAICETESTI
jgi:hypothetical protein